MTVPLSCTEITTSEQAVERMLAVANGTWSDSHNLIMQASDYGPGRFVALEQATAAEVERWATVARTLAELGR